MMKPRFGMNGKRMGRIDGDRRDHREDLVEEPLIEPGAVGWSTSSVGIDDDDAVLRQLVAQLQPARVLLGHQFLGELAHPIELLGRRQSVLARLDDAWRASGRRDRPRAP